MLERFEDWPERMMAEIDRVRECRFEWGVNDCVLFGADIILAMTGVDFMAPYRGTYSTAVGAALALQRSGHRTIPNAVSACLGERLPNEMLMQRGDICLVHDEHSRPAVGVCVGDRIAALSLNGLVLIPSTLASAVWRV